MNVVPAGIGAAGRDDEPSAALHVPGLAAAVDAHVARAETREVELETGERLARDRGDDGARLEPVARHAVVEVEVVALHLEGRGSDLGGVRVAGGRTCGGPHRCPAVACAAVASASVWPSAGAFVAALADPAAASADR